MIKSAEINLQIPQPHERLVHIWGHSLATSTILPWTFPAPTSSHTVCIDQLLNWISPQLKQSNLAHFLRDRMEILLRRGRGVVYRPISSVSSQNCSNVHLSISMLPSIYDYSKALLQVEVYPCKCKQWNKGGGGGTTCLCCLDLRLYLIQILVKSLES